MHQHQEYLSVETGFSHSKLSLERSRLMLITTIVEEDSTNMH